MSDTNLETWTPENFGFDPVDPHRRLVFRHKEFELRKKPNNYWLMRRLRKVNGKHRMVVKWYHEIKPNDLVFAMMLFTKGVK